MPTGPKRPTDVVHVMKLLTGEADDGAPEDGKANRAVIALLEKWLKGLDCASVELVSGHSTPLKTVLLHRVTVLPPFGR